MPDAIAIDKAALLSRSPLFSGLGPEELDRLVKYASTKRVRAGEVAFHKGAPGDQMFALMSGRVKIVTLSEEGKEVVLAVLNPGDIFGEISLLDGRERTATVLAAETSELLVLERREFIPFLEQHPKIAIKLLEAICKRLRLADELLEDVVFLNLPMRLAKRLLSLAERYGRNTPRGVRIEIKLSQQELGNMVGTSRESVNKQMRAWEDEGLISVEHGYITVSQPGKLKLFAG
jgi:CRP/FNR family transcriptional regulator, cyclic AMP receptor protein